MNYKFLNFCRGKLSAPDFQELVDCGLLAMTDGKFDVAHEYFLKASSKDPTNIAVNFRFYKFYGNLVIFCRNLEAQNRVFSCKSLFLIHFRKAEIKLFSLKKKKKKKIAKKQGVHC